MTQSVDTTDSPFRISEIILQNMERIIQTRFGSAYRMAKESKAAHENHPLPAIRDTSPWTQVSLSGLRNNGGGLRQLEIMENRLIALGVDPAELVQGAPLLDGPRARLLAIFDAFPKGARAEVLRLLERLSDTANPEASLQDSITKIRAELTRPSPQVQILERARGTLERLTSGEVELGMEQIEQINAILDAANAQGKQTTTVR